MSYMIKTDEKTIEFFRDMKNEFTVKDARKYKFAGYIFLWKLRDAGLIKENGITGSNEKIWSFTEKGSSLREHFVNVDKILRGEQ